MTRSREEFRAELLALAVGTGRQLMDASLEERVAAFNEAVAVIPGGRRCRSETGARQEG